MRGTPRPFSSPSRPLASPRVAKRRPGISTSKVAALFAFVVLAMLHFAAMNWETVRQEREEDPEGATQLHIYGHQGEQELEGISKLHLYSKAEEQDLEGANKLHIYNKRQADPRCSRGSRGLGVKTCGDKGV